MEHKYRAPSDLLYLTGFGEPESFAVLTPWRDEKFTMFVRPRDKEKIARIVADRRNLRDRFSF